MDDYITRFRNKVSIDQTASARISDIIAQSLSRVEAILERLNKAIPIIFINTDKESGDESIMYSYNDDAVVVGDYITVLGNSHLVYKEVKNLKREDYIDCFNTVLCNITFILDTSTIKAYFRGSLRTAQSEETNLAQNFGIDSKGDALLILPLSVGLKTNTTLSIDDKGWRVTFVDNITNKDITYAALEEYSIPDTTKLSVVEDPDYTPPVLEELIPGVEYSLPTEGGYIHANKKVEIVSRAATLVKIKVPFGTETGITIDTKLDDVIVSTDYTIGA